jgi:hypothetical protein
MCSVNQVVQRTHQGSFAQWVRQEFQDHADWINVSATGTTTGDSGRTEVVYRNGPFKKESLSTSCSPRLLEATSNNLFAEIEKRGYKPVLEALPYDLRKKNDVQREIRSLRYHAEKKGVVRLLVEQKNNSRDSYVPLSMRVNISVCADCHSFLQHAAKALGKKINVTDAVKHHVFG